MRVIVEDYRSRGIGHSTIQLAELKLAIMENDFPAIDRQLQRMQRQSFYPSVFLKADPILARYSDNPRIDELMSNLEQSALHASEL